MGSWKNLSPAASLAIGVVVGLLSTCVQSLGLTLQRKSHMLEDEKEEAEDRRPAYRRRRWQVGMFLFLIANIIGSTIQITTLPLPLLSTLQASGLVFNSILASLLLKEPWTWRTAGGTFLVAGGAILISFFSALPEPSHNLDQLLALLRMRGFLVWFCLSLVFVLAVLIMDFVMRKVVSTRQRDSPRLLLIRGMSYGAISGILSAHALLLAKSAVELIVRSVADKKNQFSNYRSWLLVLAFLILALSQLYYLHLGLRLISTSVLYPFVFCIYNIVAILDGLIYFRHMDRLSPLQSGLIALGTVILLAGVLALSWRFQDEPEDIEHHSPLGKNEIPQTVLAPGMGFVGDPDSDEAASGGLREESEGDDENNATDLDERDAGEREPLIESGLVRSRKNTIRAVSPQTARKRRRAATWREVMNIWEELGESEDRYGTFAGASDSRARSTERSQSKHNRPISSGGKSVDMNTGGQSDGEPGSSAMIQRAKTMPNSRRTGNQGRRRSSQYQNSALFSDMLNLDWWRSRRKRAVDDSVATAVDES